MKLQLLKVALAAAAFSACAAASSLAQTPMEATDKTEQTASPTVPETVPTAPKPTVEMPVIESVREIRLGMTIDEITAKLGKPEVQDKTGMLFELADGDSLQVGLDPDKKVRTIAAIFTADSKVTPAFADVFGPDAGEPEGDVYKLERYNEAGFWVSFSRTNSIDKPMTIVTMRKIS